MKEYDVRQRFAVREKKNGRAKGGILLAIRKELEVEIEWEEEMTEETLAAKWKRDNETWLWGITYMRHSKKENYKVMEEWMERNREGITILNGDFNARTAIESGLWDSEGDKEARKSKDKIINEEGMDLVSWVEEQGIGIGNGATRGDEDGEWTQIGQRGCTTIDYVIRNEKGKDKIEDMIVANRIKSDHAPIEMKLRWKGKTRKENREKRGEEVRRVTRWNPGGITDYVKKLERHGKARNWTEIKEKVLTTIPRVELRGKKEDGYEEK